MPLALSLVVPPALYALEPIDLAVWAADAGLAAIDSEPEDGDARRAAIIGAGLGLGPMRIRASLADSDDATRRSAVETACAVIDRAAELGVEILWTLPRNFRNDAPARHNFDRAVDSLTVLASHAERRGVRVAIENCPFGGQNAITTPEAWDALFAAVPSPALGICLDPSHCVWQGVEVMRAVRDYSPRIYHVQAKDTELLPELRHRYGVGGPQLDPPPAGGPDGGWWRHRLPGSGAVDWAAFLGALRAVGYDGLVSLENEDPDWTGSADLALRGVARAVSHLREASARQWTLNSRTV